MRSGKKWTEKEIMVAMYVYWLIPFSKTVKTNPIVIRYAHLLQRSPGALAMKLGNLGSLDSELKESGIKGLPNRSKLDEVIWRDFLADPENFIFRAEKEISRLEGKALEQKYADILDEALPLGEDKRSYVKTRVNQQFFRKAVLTAYQQRCAITGLALPELLIASHIIPWARDKSQRLNPRNGICLNALHDRAFDQGLITLDKHYRVIHSKKLKASYTGTAARDMFEAYEHQEIFLPDRFKPSLEAIQYHNDCIFLG